MTKEDLGELPKEPNLERLLRPQEDQSPKYRNDPGRNLEKGRVWRRPLQAREDSAEELKSKY